MRYADPHRNFDGEIMAFGAMSGNDIDHYITELTSFGYVGPEKGDESEEGGCRSGFCEARPSVISIQEATCDHWPRAYKRWC